MSHRITRRDMLRTSALAGSVIGPGRAKWSRCTGLLLSATGTGADELETVAIDEVAVITLETVGYQFGADFVHIVDPAARCAPDMVVGVRGTVETGLVAAVF